MKFEDDVEKTLAKIERDLAGAFENLIEELKSELGASVDEVVITTAMLTFSRSIQEAVQAGGDLSARHAGQIVFALNVTESNTSQFIREYQAAKIREMTAELQNVIGNTILEAVNEGVGSAEISRRIRNNIGLTEKQIEIVRNYEQSLRNRKRDALSRALRDKRFDRTVLRSILTQRDLTEDQIQRMVGRYRDRFIKHRATTIARTEAIRLLNVGQREFWNQAVADGRVDRTDLKRKWIPTKDGRVREAHATIPKMNPDGVGMDEPFKSPLGNIMFPGDPSAPAANVVNCRCVLFHKVEL